MENKSKTAEIAAGVILIIIVGIVFWYLLQKKTMINKTIQPIAPVSNLSPSEAEDTLGGQIFRVTQNPGSKFPKTNPFQETDINPLKNIIKNPF